MSDNWEVGDLAVRIARDPDANCPFEYWSPRIGQLVTVAQVQLARDETGDWAGLNFAEDPDASSWSVSAFRSQYFRKVTPEEADAFDLEVIKHLKPTPAETV